MLYLIKNYGHKIIVLLLCMSLLQSCLSRQVSSWEALPELEMMSRASASERAAYYRKFAIARFLYSEQDRYYLIFSTEAAPERWYNFDNYYPSVVQLVPEAKAMVAKAESQQELRMAFLLPAMIGLSLIVFIERGSNSNPANAETNTPAYFAVLGFGSLFALIIASNWFGENNEALIYEELRVKYNTALRKKLGLNQSDLFLLPS